MSADIELSEYQPTPCDLSETDARYLAESFPNKIAVFRRPGEAGYLLDPGPRVGIVELPSGRRIRCNPKVPVANVFFMLATAERFASPFRDQDISFERIDELFDFLVEHLANLIDRLLVRGLYRAYVDREENLNAVRGRILIGEDLRRNHILRQRTFCQYSELTWDVPENRVIRQTVYILARFVRQKELRLRLHALDRQLGEVDPTPLPLSVFDRFQYHRLNEGYRGIHRLCRLLLQAASVSEHAGDHGFKAFLLDMNLLYEQFITESLRDRIDGDLTLTAQFKSSLDVAQKVTIRPDLMLRRAGRSVLVADCKYKRKSSGDSGNADLYQMLAYCTAERLTHGALIYPKEETGFVGDVIVRNSPIEIRYLQVDLGADLPQLRQSLDALVLELVHLSPGASAGRIDEGIERMAT